MNQIHKNTNTNKLKIYYIFLIEKKKYIYINWLDPDQNEWLRNTDSNHHVPLVIRLFFGQFLQTNNVIS